MKRKWSRKESGDLFSMECLREYSIKKESDSCFTIHVKKNSLDYKLSSCATEEEALAIADVMWLTYEKEDMILKPVPYYIYSMVLYENDKMVQNYKKGDKKAIGGLFGKILREAPYADSDITKLVLEKLLQLDVNEDCEKVVNEMTELHADSWPYWDKVPF